MKGDLLRLEQAESGVVGYGNQSASSLTEQAEARS